MKKIVFFMVLILFLVNLFAKGIITFKENVHDFQDIKEENGPYEYTFEFTNTGDEEFKLTKVKAG